jgi:hypothetical protein
VIQRLREVSRFEVYGEWLKHEYLGRYRQYIDRCFPGSLVLIKSPDYSDDASNLKREGILHEIRGPILDGIPPDTSWGVSLFDQSLFRELALINSSPWRQLTSGTLSAADAASAIHADPSFSRKKFGEPIEYILDHYADLARQDSKIIAVGAEDGPQVVIDGVHRTIALLLFHIRVTTEFTPRKVYFGTSSSRYTKAFC